MQVSDTMVCCRCGKDVTQMRYAARKPLPPGAKTEATLYDCPRCAVTLLVAELKKSQETSKQVLEFYKNKATTLDSQLTEEKGKHQETKDKLKQKTLELDNAQMQCTALQSAFSEYRDGLPADQQVELDVLVAKKLDKIQSTFATGKARWLEQQARELEQKAAKDSQAALDLREKAKQLRGPSNFQTLLNQNAARHPGPAAGGSLHPGPAAGGSLPKKPKTGGV